MRWFGGFRNKRHTAPASAVEGSRARVAGVPYALPRNEEELNRLDFQHYLLRNAFKGNFAAPLNNPRAILDVGCGTGRWAREMSLAFPAANVVGVDVKAPPADAMKAIGDPREVRFSFTPGNVLEGLPFPDASFDFTHMRLLFLAIPASRWEYVVRESVRVTRPGGWVELVEAGPEEQGGPAIDQLLSWGIEMLGRRGIDGHYGSRVGELLQRAHLAQVGFRRFDIPLGIWGERVGTMMEADFFAGIHALGDAVAAMGIATSEQFQGAMVAGRAYVNRPDARCIAPFYVAWGQRTERTDAHFT